MLLSIVIPFYKKLDEFKRILPHNARFFRKEEYEVVLVVDSPSSKEQILDLIALYPEIKWRVLYNSQDHAWRPPTIAINVGIKNALGEHILVVSPESAFWTDVPEVLLAEAQKGNIAVGRLYCQTFDYLDQRMQAYGPDFSDGMLKNPPPRDFSKLFYGSICVKKSHLEAVHGYDESLTKWGGDDDNVRARMVLNGVQLVKCPNAKVVHFSFNPRIEDIERIRVPQTDEEIWSIGNPKVAVTNPDGWGNSYNEVIYDWAKA